MNPVPTWLPPNWLLIARQVLELLYFASGIGILVAALIGLRQIRIAAQQATIAAQQVTLAAEQLKLTKDIAQADARRNAVKLAAEQCAFFGDKVVKEFTTFIELSINKLQWAKVQHSEFEIDANGELRTVKHDPKPLEAEWVQVCQPAVAFLNDLEAFAIPFAQGVASEEIGFAETAYAFRVQVTISLPVIAHLRRTEGCRFPSILKLLHLWMPRLMALEMAPQLEAMKKVVEAAKQNTIKLI